MLLILDHRWRLFFLFEFINRCLSSKTHSFSSELFSDQEWVIWWLLHHILWLKLPDDVKSILEEWLLTFLMIDQDYDLYQWAPTNCKHWMGSVHLVRRHTVTPREGYMAHWIFFWQWWWRMQSKEYLEIWWLCFSNQNSVCTSDCCQWLVIVHTLSVDLWTIDISALIITGIDMRQLWTCEWRQGRYFWWDQRRHA